jgi:hypothetical protein
MPILHMIVVGASIGLDGPLSRGLAVIYLSQSLMILSGSIFLVINRSVDHLKPTKSDITLPTPNALGITNKRISLNPTIDQAAKTVYKYVLSESVRGR